MSNSASSADDAQPVSMPEPLNTRELESPPLTIGPRRLHYAFSVALPAVHLTFVSILQGVIVGQLLGTLPLPSHVQSASPAAIGSFILAQHAYLAYFISGALILIVWKQFVQVSLFYLWPLTITQIALMLLVASAEMIACREIEHFYGWLFGIGLIGFIGGIIRLYNIHLRNDWDYEFLDGRRRDNKIEWETGPLYCTLGAIVLVFATAEHFQWLNLGLSPQAVQWIVLSVLAGLVAIVIVLDRSGTKRHIDDALGPREASDLERTGSAGIRYRKPTGEQG